MVGDDEVRPAAKHPGLEPIVFLVSGIDPAMTPIGTIGALVPAALPPLQKRDLGGVVARSLFAPEPGLC